jgi:hypothetical protein
MTLFQRAALVSIKIVFFKEQLKSYVLLLRKPIEVQFFWVVTPCSVSEVHAVSIFRVKHGMDLRNVNILQRHHTASEPRRTRLERWPPWKPQNLHYKMNVRNTAWYFKSFITNSKQLPAINTHRFTCVDCKVQLIQLYIDILPSNGMNAYNPTVKILE